MALPAKLRLKKNDEFQSVFKKGKSIAGNFLFVKFSGNNLNHSRFGVVVSSKVSNKATERNKVKRKISESISAIYKKQKPSFDIVIITVPAILDKSQKEIKSKLEKILNQIFSQHN